MGALALHDRQGALAAGEPALVPVAIPTSPRSGPQPRLDGARRRAAAIVGASLVGQTEAAVGRRAGVSQQLVAHWANPARPETPNVAHLLAEAGPFARAVLAGTLADLDGECVPPRAQLEREAAVLIARMGAVLAAAGAICPAVAPIAAARLAKDLGALVEQAERLRRALGQLAREER